MIKVKMTETIKKATELENVTELQINYKEYPEYMFAIIAAFLPENEGRDLRKIAGNDVFRSNGENGRTYKNGLRHSYNDQPVVIRGQYQAWYKDGKVHRDSDNPAVIYKKYQAWYKDGKFHRDGDRPAVIHGSRKEWFRHGKSHREGDQPAINSIFKMEWYRNGERVGNLETDESFKNNLKLKII